MSQTEILMVLALGFCLALITAMLLSRFVWNIGQRISRHRIARERPTEIRDLEADRDQLRASQAMLGRKYLNQIDDLKANAVAHQAEVSRHRNRVQSLIEESNMQRNELDVRQDKIAELNNHVEMLDLEVKERGTQISNLSTELSEREADSGRLMTSLSENESKIAQLSADLSAQESSNNSLIAALNERDANQKRLLTAMGEKEADNARLSAELSNMSGLLDQSKARLLQIESDLNRAMTKSDEVTRQHLAAVNELAQQRERTPAPPLQERPKPAFTPAEAQQALHQSFRAPFQSSGPTGDRADIMMARPNRYNFDRPTADPASEAQPIDPDSDIARMMNAARRSMRQSQQIIEENQSRPAVSSVAAIAQRLRAQKDET